VAFISAQLGAALLLLPWVHKLARWLAPQAAVEPRHGTPGQLDVGEVQARLLRAFGAQRAALSALFGLAQSGERSEGRAAEHRLTEARSALEALLREPLPNIAPTFESERLTSIAFGSLQLQRSLEALLLEVERLTDSRVGESDVARGGGESDRASAVRDAASDEATLREMQDLLLLGLSLLADSVQAGVALELESARAREIQMNMIEARTRAALIADQRRHGSEQRRFGLLKVIDGYESAGNQVYRLAELLSELYMPSTLPTSLASAPEGRYET